MGASKNLLLRSLALSKTEFLCLINVVDMNIPELERLKLGERVHLDQILQNHIPRDIDAVSALLASMREDPRTVKYIPCEYGACTCDVNPCLRTHVAVRNEVDPLLPSMISRSKHGLIAFWNCDGGRLTVHYVYNKPAWFTLGDFHGAIHPHGIVLA
jgi:hypothetical protein